MKIIQFGGTKKEQTELGKLVLSSEKIATSSLKELQRLKNLKETKVDDVWSIHDGNNKELCQVQVTKVCLLPFGEIDEIFAKDEGDGTFENWYDIHFNYYTNQLREVDLLLSKSTILECVYFKKITQ